MKSTFRIISQDLTNHIPWAELNSAQTGAIVTFCGTVRNINDNQKVEKLEYEADIALAEKEAGNIFIEAKQKFDILHAYGLHRVGELNIGDIAVWISVSARHRDQAYQASRYLIDQIKIRLPIWKKEHYTTGQAQWKDIQNQKTQMSPNVYEEQIYYSRQLNLSIVGTEGQNKLRNSRVLVVGAGGLGNYALMHLASSGVGIIGICEHDRLEIHNLHRQSLYSYADINQPKAQLAQKRLSQINPFIKIQIHNTRLTPKNIRSISAGYDLIIDGTDNFETKFLLNDYCVLHRTPLIQSSVYQGEGQLRFYQPNHPDACCLRCLWPNTPEAHCVGNCQEAGVLGFVPGILGTWQAAEAIKWTLGQPTLESNKTMLIDLLSNKIQKIKQKRNPACPLCGKNPSIHSIKSAKTDWIIDATKLSLENLSAYAIIDIRSKEEQTRTPLSRTISYETIPQDQLEKGEYHFKTNVQYLLICAKGIRSSKTAKLFYQDKNLKNVCSLSIGVSDLNALLTTQTTSTL